MLKCLSMKFEVSANPLEKISSDGLVVFAFSGNDKTKFFPLKGFKKIDTLLEGQLGKVAELEGYSAKRGEILSVIPIQKSLFARVFIVGLGKKENFILDDLRRASGILASQVKKKLDSLSLEIPEELDNDFNKIANVIFEGFLLGSYEFNKYKKKTNNGHSFETVIISSPKDKAGILKSSADAQLYAEATILARDLVNEPGSIVTPTVLANVAKDIAKKDKNIKCTILEKQDAEKMGMGSFLAVARGSDTPPKFIHLEYNPVTPSKRKLALVGKGITFDSGGYDVKPGDSMVSMKGDMAGAAAVLGVFSVISKIKPNFSVMGIIAATPNLINGSAFLPDDIVKTMNGKTVEIITTDAEGRMALADQITYAIKKGATEIVDLATLTAAIMVALGPDIAGIFSNNRDLVEKVKAAAFDAGEKVWEMPLEKDYVKLSESPVADMANVANIRWGGPITSALFLEEFVEDKPWVHMDIGPAFIKNGFDIGAKGGTGYGVRTMLNLLKGEKK